MNRNDVIELVKRFQRDQCELSDAEAKRARNDIPQRLYEVLSAFANRSGGGLIALGIDEANGFQTSGIEDPQRIQSNLVDMASKMVPPLRLDVTVQSIDGSTIVVARVPEVANNDKPCYYQPQGLHQGSYLRSGNSNRRLSEYEVSQYMSSRTQPIDDRAPITEAGLDDLDQSAARTYLEALASRNAIWKDGSLEELLVRARAAAVVDGMLRPTLAGLLMFGRYPQQFLPQLRITFIQYFGQTEEELSPTGARFLDNRSFEGPIPDLVSQAVAYTITRIRQAGLIEGALRRDIPEYPLVAIREAIANAVGHRDYSNAAKGSQVQIRLFADRMEIQSPGGLYGPVTVENIDTEQSTRNSVIMRMMEDAHVAENRGTGIPTMVSALRQAQLSVPRFDDRRSSFWVTFYNHTLMNPETVQWLNQFAELDLSDHQRVALAFLRERGSITNADYRRLNSCDMTEANHGLARLREQHLVVQIGSSKRWTSYQLTPRAMPAVVMPQTREQQVLDYAQTHGGIANRDCQQLLAVGREAAKTILRNMVKSGLLIKSGQRRATRYIVRRP